MAVHCTPSGTDPGREEYRWPDFWRELKVCSHCGRISYLHDTCPDCGTPMKKAVRFVPVQYVLWNLPPAVGVAAVQLWLLWVVRSYPVLEKVLAIVLSLAVHGIMILPLWSLWKTNLVHISQVPPADVLRYQIDCPAGGLRGMIRSWRIFDLARDAYYLDAAWLERQSVHLQQGNAERRDMLLGRSLWLSAICDTPRLALTRLMLLSKAPIHDGFEADLDAIMNQLLPTPEHVEHLLREHPQQWRTLCDCVMFDMVGLSLHNRRSISLALARLMRDRSWSGSLTSSDWMQLAQTLIFCGPEVFGEDETDDPDVTAVRTLFRQFVPELEWKPGQAAEGGSEA